MVRAARVTAGAAVAVASLSGCGGAGPSALADRTPAATPTPTASPAPRPTGAKAAKAALTKAVAALESDRTGLVTHEVGVEIGRWFSTRRHNATYDLKRDRWESEFTVATNMTEGARTRQVTFDVAGRPGAFFMKMRQGADAGVWHRMKVNLLDLSAENVALATVLESVKATKISYRRNGGSIVTGRMPTADAVWMLALPKQLIDMDVTDRQLAGTTKVTLHLDAEGRPVKFAFTGSDVSFANRKAPVALRQAVGAGHYTAIYRGIGMGVDIDLPKHAKIMPVTETDVLGL